MPVHVPLHIPRHAYSLRERARAGDIWRAFQEAAVLGSSEVGWPPMRYRREACAFVVRQMTVVHHSECTYGEPVIGETWVGDFRRGLLTRREIRLRGEGGRAISDATQEWVHVHFGRTAAGEVKLRPSRASTELLDAFEQESRGEPPRLPTWEALLHQSHITSVPLRLTEMDPLGHLNHPAYVDLADEHTSELMAQAGLDPVQLQPVAEQVTYRAGASAPGAMVIESTLCGLTQDAVVIHHNMRDDNGTIAAEAHTVRRLASEPIDALLKAFCG